MAVPWPLGACTVLPVQPEPCRLEQKAGPDGTLSFSDLHCMWGDRAGLLCTCGPGMPISQAFLGEGAVRLRDAGTSHPCSHPLCDLVPLHLAGSDMGLGLRILNTICASGVHWEWRPPGVRNSG